MNPVAGKLNPVSLSISIHLYLSQAIDAST